MGVDLHCEINLFEILAASTDADIAFGWAMIPIHGRENNEDDHDDEQFDQRKRCVGGRRTPERAWLLHGYGITQNGDRLQWRMRWNGGERCDGRGKRGTVEPCQKSAEERRNTRRASRTGLSQPRNSIYLSPDNLRIAREVTSKGFWG